MIKFIQVCLLFFTVITYFIVDSTISGYDPLLLLLTLLGVIAVIFLFVFPKQPYVGFKKEYFRISTLFIVGYLIVFFQRYADVLIGNAEPNNRYLFVSPDLINKCALLSLIGLMCFIIGYSFYNPPILRSNQVAAPKYTPVKWLNYILFITVILFIYNYGVYYLSNVYTQDFLESNKGSIAAYLEVAIRSLIFSILILHTRNGRIKGETFVNFVKSLGLLFHLSLFTYLGLFLLTGDRGPLISVALAYFLAYIIKIRPKIKLITFVILLLIASFSLSIIGIVRQMDSNLAFRDRVISTINENTIRERNSIINPTAELSSSVRSLHYAVNYVPNQHPYLYGSFQFRELLAVIPFSNLITKHILDDSFQYRTSAYFITYINQGIYYNKGDGSNVVADLYLSFGVFGVIIGLFLFGIFIKKIEVVCFTYDPSNIPLLYYSLTFAYIALAVYTPRSTLLNPLKEAVFSFLIIVLYNNFSINTSKSAKNSPYNK
jgi:hypothetical protein